MTGQTGDFSPPQAQHTAHVAADQAKEVTAEAGRQANDLLNQGKDQLQAQARTSQTKAAESLHGLADQLEGMTDQTEQPGVARDLVREAATRTRKVASWLDSREPGDLLDEVRGFARRKPGVFLAGAAVAGVLVGRLTRGVAQSASSDSSQPRHAAPQATPATPPPPQAPPQAAPPAPPLPQGTPPPPVMPPPVTPTTPYGTGPA